MVALMGFVSFLFSVIVAVLVVFLTFKLFMRLSRGARLKDFKEGNAAMAITVIGDLLAFAILMSKSLFPISSIIQNLFGRTNLSFVNVLSSLGIILAYIAGAYLLSVGTVALSSFLFQKLTAKLNELKLIQKNNIAVAIMLAGVVITIAVMVQHGLGDFLNSIIPLVTQ